jgi:hypothetical protein
LVVLVLQDQQVLQDLLVQQVLQDLDCQVRRVLQEILVLQVLLVVVLLALLALLDSKDKLV